MSGEALERKYRRLLQALPAWYRQAHGEALTGRFMKRAQTGDAEADEHRASFGWPAARDVAEVARLGARLRLGGVGSPARSRALGDGVRRFALLGLLGQAVTGTTDVLLSLWLAGLLPVVPPGGGSGLLPGSLSPSLAVLAASLPGVAWLAAFLALAAGRVRAARVSACAALLLVCFRVAVTTPAAQPAHWPAAAAPLLLGGLILVATAGFHEDAPRIRGTGWVIGYAAALVAAVGAHLSAWLVGPVFLPWVDLPGLYVVVATVLGIAHLAGPKVTQRPPEPAWTIALALLAGVAAAFRALSATAYAGAGAAAPPLVVTAVSVQLAAAVVMATALAVVAARSLPQARDGVAG